MITLKTNFRFGLILASMMASHSSSAGWLFGPSNYNECVADGTKNAHTNQIANMAIDACKRKYQVELSPNQLDQVEIKSYPIMPGKVSFEIYNKNNSLAITKLIISIAPKNKYANQPVSAPFIVTLDIFIPPSSSQNITKNTVTDIFHSIYLDLSGPAPEPPFGTIDSRIMSAVQNGHPASMFNIEVMKIFGVPQ